MFVTYIDGVNTGAGLMKIYFHLYKFLFNRLETSVIRHLRFFVSIRAATLWRAMSVCFHLPTRMLFTTNAPQKMSTCPGVQQKLMAIPLCLGASVCQTAPTLCLRWCAWLPQLCHNLAPDMMMEKLLRRTTCHPGSI